MPQKYTTSSHDKSKKLKYYKPKLGYEFIISGTYFNLLIDKKIIHKYKITRYFLAEFLIYFPIEKINGYDESGSYGIIDFCFDAYEPRQPDTKKLSK